MRSRVVRTPGLPDWTAPLRARLCWGQATLQATCSRRRSVEWFFRITFRLLDSAEPKPVSEMSRFTAKIGTVAGAALLFLLGQLQAGDLTRRFELTLERVLQGGPPAYTRELLLADVIPNDIRRFTNFSGDLSGRYVGALALASLHSGQAHSRLQPLIDDILGHQKPDGHFGDPMGLTEVADDDMARLWGNGRMLIGLLEYYDADPRPEVLKAARRIGDFLVSMAPRFNSRAVRRFFTNERFATGYICWTQNLEGLAALYRRTSDNRYLELAREMAARTSRHPSQHSHGFLSTLRGILELARLTGDLRYLQQVEGEWKSIVHSENLLVQGAMPEAFAPSIERDEGCSQADWLRLNLELWRETQSTRYLEQAERTLFNEFFLNQFSSGDFGHIRLRETGVGAETTRAWWCCTLHGLRAFPAVFDSVFRSEGEKLFYELPLDGEGSLEGLRVVASSSLERDGAIRLKIAASDGSRRTISVRVPAWVSKLEAQAPPHVELAGPRVGPQAGPKGRYLSLTGAWTAGDEVVLDYRFRTRLEPHPSRSDYTAAFLGPWLLAVEEASSPYFFDEPYAHNRVEVASLGAENDAVEQDRPPAIVPVTTPAANFTVPVAHHDVEWIPAGYPNQLRHATLRPVAERTASARPSRWEFWFRTQDASSNRADSAAPESPARSGWLPFSLLVLTLIVVTTAVWRKRRCTAR